MKQLQVLFLFILQISFYLSVAQPVSVEKQGSILYEKVYLQTDRELYAPGDDIWLKSYLVSGINNILIPGYKNIYIQLISDSGKVAMSKMLLSKEGTATGDFQLPLEMADGTYTLRAFTRYLENFGPDSYFHKKVVIAGSKNSLELEAENNEEKNQKIDVAFLPEGGKLVLNARNLVAFKVIGEDGRGVAVSGKIIDETGAQIELFSTTYKGMGRFLLMPQQGKSYTAVLNEYPGFKYNFDPADPDAIALNCKPDGNYLLVTLSRNLMKSDTEEFLLKASHKGIELFFSKVTLTEFQHAQRLFKGLFPRGISKITCSRSHVIEPVIVAPSYWDTFTALEKTRS